jgi:hypothetical protein
MTHRVFSRNAASSRAIPVSKMIKQVWHTPVVPVWFGAHQSGMQAAEELMGFKLISAKFLWTLGGKIACALAWLMMKAGMHKQLVNRVLEPWSWITVIVTATEWSNFFALRTHEDAQPEIRHIALLAKNQFDVSIPTLVTLKGWHLPLVDDYERLLVEGYNIDEIVKICVGRCARISYLTHDGARDPRKDIELCEKLRCSGHMSPFEHAAHPLRGLYPSGNFVGWQASRKSIPNEDDFSKVVA